MSMAVKYNMQKKRKKDCMADGGPVKPYSSEYKTSSEALIGGMKKAFSTPEAEAKTEDVFPKESDTAGTMAGKREKSMHKMGYAKGGEVGGCKACGYVDEEMQSGYQDMPEHSEDDEGDLINAIMAKRMSKGGQVANDTGDGEEVDKMENQFDDLVLRDDMEFHETGKNSGDEIGNEKEDEDEHDMVSSIMKSRKKKDRMPSPA